MTITASYATRGAMIDVEAGQQVLRRIRALVSVDMSVPAGTVQGLLGPNGAGKTTVGRAARGGG